MKNKKGQAFMEFLMTYGWVILATIIVIGILVYFGFFSIPYEPEPEFTIYKESYEIYDCSIKTSHLIVNGSVNIDQNFIDKYCKRKKLEVDDIRLEWFERCEQDDCVYCIDGEKDCIKKGLVVKFKKDLTTSWLHENSECNECAGEGFIHQNRCCYNDGNFDGEKIVGFGEEYCKGCKNYKYRNYIVETK